MQETVVELAVTVGLTLQEVVFDGALVELVRLLLLAFQLTAQHTLTLHRSLVFAFRTRAYILHFAIERSMHLVKAVGHFLDLGILRAELTGKLRELILQIELFGPKFRDQE